MGELFTFIDDTKEAALTANILPGKRAIDLKFKQHGSFFGEIYCSTFIGLLYAEFWFRFNS